MLQLHCRFPATLDLTRLDPYPPRRSLTHPLSARSPAQLHRPTDPRSAGTRACDAPPSHRRRGPVVHVLAGWLAGDGLDSAVRAGACARFALESVLHAHVLGRVVRM